MSRRKWPHDATWSYTVRATPRQLTVWQRAADFCGTDIAVYLAHAGTKFAAILERRINRVMKQVDAEREQQKAKEREG